MKIVQDVYRIWKSFGQMFLNPYGSVNDEHQLFLIIFVCSQAGFKFGNKVFMCS